VPNYDYHCLECNRTFEQNRLIKERDYAKPCPACDSLDVERLIAAPGISHIYGAYKKVPEGFKDVLRKIKKNNAGSLIEV
jgi:putative FmdB family regulatory protein